jgi:nitronate monooxygenase
MRKEAEKQNNVDFMSMWAGQSAYLSKGYPAAELINKLIEDVNILLEKLNEGRS